MDFLSDIDGNQPTFHSHVHVVNLSTLSTPFTHMRHIEIRDTFANLKSEVCFDVEIEPKLQSLQGESFVNSSIKTDEDARLDVKANGLWFSRFIRAFFYVKFFNLHSKTSRILLKDVYKKTQNTNR